MSLQLTSAPEHVLLADGTTEEWSAIFAHTERRIVAAGDGVLGAGDPPRTLCLLIDGQVSARTAAGAVVREMPAPAVFGELSFLDGRPRSLALVADVQADVLLLTWEQFEALRASDPELAHRVLVDLAAIVAARLRDMTTLVVSSLEG